MDQYLAIFHQCPLFARISSQDLLRMLSCLRAQVVSYEKGQIILHQGDTPRLIGMVITGCVHVIATDLRGNHSIIACLETGNLFAETFACAQEEILPVSVVAAVPCQVLLLEHARVISGCRNGCIAHSHLVTNLMRCIALKNISLTRKLEYVTQRTTRDKLMTYLLAQAKQAGCARFSIPFDRQGLADYLGVERSAMSAELSKLKKLGLIDYKKNEFEMLELLDGLREGHG